MEKKSNNLGIAVAAGLGSIIGLFVTLRLGLEVWLGLPIGTLAAIATSFAAYGPREVKHATVTTFPIVKKGLAAPFHANWPKVWDRTVFIFQSMAHGILLIAGAIASVMLWFTVFDFQAAPGDQQVQYFTLSFGVTILGAVIIASIACGSYTVSSESKSWRMPLARSTTAMIYWIADFCPSEKRDEVMPWRDFLIASCFMFILTATASLALTLLIAFLTLDIIGTIVFLCASNQCIAAMLGAITGLFGAGCLGYLAKIPPESDVHFFAGGIMGAAFGLSIHHLRKWLDEKTEEETSFVVIDR